MIFYYEVATEAKLVHDGAGSYGKGYVSMEIDLPMLPTLTAEQLETITAVEIPAILEKQTTIPAKYLTPITKEAWDAAHAEEDD